MILPDKFLEEAIKYCRLHNIPIEGGKIPTRHIREIQNYINERIKKERAITKRLKENTRLRLGTSIQSIMSKMIGSETDSPIEEYLWDALERAELSFLAKRQFEIGHYRIDIAFPKSKLAVECDGQQYHRDNQLQLEKDQKRDNYLAKKGWRTLRIEGIAIRRDINYCIERIKQALGIFTEVI